jgi:hypothetical protein
VYRCARQHSEPSSDKRGARVDELHLTPLELIARIAALVPPPRTHRHRYFGVLAPNSAQRAAVTALAAPAQPDEVFPLLCPLCGGQMRLIAFITEGTQIRKILDHIGVDSEQPHISPARGPPLWDDGGDAQTVEGVHIEPDWDLSPQPAPDFEVDQRINW